MTWIIVGAACGGYVAGQLSMVVVLWLLRAPGFDMARFPEPDGSGRRVEVEIDSRALSARLKGILEKQEFFDALRRTRWIQ